MCIPATLEKIRDLIRRGDFISAWDLATHSLQAFPDDQDIQYLAVLSLARSGATEQAANNYESWGLGNRADEDCLALGARITKDIANSLPSGPFQTAAYEKAARNYFEVFKITGGYFPAINAASLMLLSGDLAGAQTLATQVIDICNDKRLKGEHEYFLLATLAEANLILRDDENASRLFSEALHSASDDYASVASTFKQLSLLCNKLGIVTRELFRAALPPVLHYAGHIVKSVELTDERFPIEELGRVKREVDDYFDKHRPIAVFGSLAAGADILIAEAAIDRNIELNIVLPFEVDEFKSLSVEIAGADWCARFSSCLERAASINFSSIGGYLGDDALFSYASMMAMGLAKMRAESMFTEATQLVVWDGEISPGVAGTAADMRLWSKTGNTQSVINSKAQSAGTIAEARNHLFSLPDVPKETRDGQRRLGAILFADVKGFSKLSDAHISNFTNDLMGGLGKVLDRFGEGVLFRNTWGDAILAIFSDAKTAGVCALYMQETMKKMDLAAIGLPAFLGLRIGMHYGPIFEGMDRVLRRKSFFGANLSRAARIEPITPVGEVYATEQFAAALSIESVESINKEYVGKIPTAKDYGDLRMYILKMDQQIPRTDFSKV